MTASASIDPNEHAYIQGQSYVRTCLDPRLGYRFPADEYDHGWLAGCLDGLDKLQLGTDQSKIGEIDVLSRCSICPRRPEIGLI